MNKDIVLLLTATVQPQVDFMTISNGLERKRQYQEAIKWYLEHTPYRLVVGENSGCTDLLNDITCNEERIELVSYVEKRRGDNHGIYEMEIIHQCFERSTFLKDCNVVFKVTGRLVLLNIMSLANPLAHVKGDFLASNIERHLSYIDARFYAFNVGLYPCITIVTEGIGSQYPDVESAIAAFVKRGLIAHSLRFILFPYPYRVHGRGGVRAPHTTSHALFSYTAA